MYIYLSPILGEHSEYFYDEFIEIKNLDYSTFIGRMRAALKYGVLRSGVLLVETRFKDVKVSGTDIYNYLFNFGFDENHAVNITRLFSVNNRLTEQLVEQGFKLDDVIYGMDLKARLDALGLESATVTKSYALSDEFIVHQLLEVEIEEPLPPPPPEYEVWRPFQISVLIDCTTSDAKGRRLRRSIEFRGVFIAEKNSIIDWGSYTKKIGKSDVYKLLRDAGIVSEAVMKEYAAHKGYQDLFECAVPVFDGINLLEDLPDILVDLDESDTHKTENSLDVVDLDRPKTTGTTWGNFSDNVVYVGNWWEDEGDAIIEMRRQVQCESRW